MSDRSDDHRLTDVDSRDDPRYVRLLKRVLLGLGGAVPLAAEQAAEKEVGAMHASASPPPSPHPPAGAASPPRRGAGVAGFFTRHLGGELNVLLVRSTAGHRRWRLPGGQALVDEAPHLAYLREVGGEAGLPLSPPEEILAIDYLPGTGDDVERVEIVFKGGEVPADVRVRRSSEPELCRWVPMRETDDLCPVPERDRVRAAFEAWVTGRAAYLVGGERVTSRLG
ncbi:NUDIX domain-containing protein [Streptomyces sp. NPDC051569]|uniref:NUDIX domain-containing protein n=1 Tax=Streptomyces sp. NPDC051569 TaxID=3365661 RepID=UPI0037B3AF51